MYAEGQPTKQARQQTSSQRHARIINLDLYNGVRYLTWTLAVCLSRTAESQRCRRQQQQQSVAADSLATWRLYTKTRIIQSVSVSSVKAKFYCTYRQSVRLPSLSVGRRILRSYKAALRYWSILWVTLVRHTRVLARLITGRVHVMKFVITP